MSYARSGPGKYDDLATFCRINADAEGVVVIVLGGKLGPGFAVQGPEAFIKSLPELLEIMAADLKILRDNEPSDG